MRVFLGVARDTAHRMRSRRDCPPVFRACGAALGSKRRVDKKYATALSGYRYVSFLCSTLEIRTSLLRHCLSSLLALGMPAVFSTPVSFLLSSPLRPLMNHTFQGSCRVAGRLWFCDLLGTPLSVFLEGTNFYLPDSWRYNT